MAKVSRYFEIDLDGELPGFVYERRDHIAFITLNRPERGNALSPRMHAVARAIWSDVRDNQDVRVAVISAAGDRHFCTGFDVGEADGEEVDDVFMNLPLEESVFWSPHQNRVLKPVICAVTGLCNGGGHHFVVDADVVVASDNAKFMDSHVNVGMVGAIENIGLARRLPVGTALRMTLQGKAFRLTAQRAYQLGMVDELCASPDEARAAAEAIARDMLKNSPQAMALSKQSIWAGQEQGYTQAMQHAWNLLKQQWSHPDFVEGPRAFGEKRQPVWNPDPNARIGDDE